MDTTHRDISIGPETLSRILSSFEPLRRGSGFRFSARLGHAWGIGWRWLWPARDSVRRGVLGRRWRSSFPSSSLPRVSATTSRRRCVPVEAGGRGVRLADSASSSARPQRPPRHTPPRSRPEIASWPARLVARVRFYTLSAVRRRSTARIPTRTLRHRHRPISGVSSLTRARCFSRVISF